MHNYLAGKKNIRIMDIPQDQMESTHEIRYDLPFLQQVYTSIQCDKLTFQIHPKLFFHQHLNTILFSLKVKWNAKH